MLTWQSCQVLSSADRANAMILQLALPTASPSIFYSSCMWIFPALVIYSTPCCRVYAAPAFTVISQIAAFSVSHSRQSTNKPDCYSRHQFSPDAIIPAHFHRSCVFHIPVLSLSRTHSLVSFPLLCASSLWHFSFLYPFHVLTSQNSPACLPAAVAPEGFGGMIKWRWCALQLFFFLHPATAV